MNNNAFDERLKSVLEDIEVPYEPTSWSALSEKLDARTLPDILPSNMGAWVDDAVAHRLEHLEVPFQTAHWDKMAARLDQDQRTRRRIWFTKCAEAAVLLLLLVNLSTWVSNPASETPDRRRIAGQQPQPVPKKAKGNKRAAQASVQPEAGSPLASILDVFSIAPKTSDPSEQVGQAIDLLNPMIGQPTGTVLQTLEMLANSEAAQQLAKEAAAQPIAQQAPTLPALDFWYLSQRPSSVPNTAAVNALNPRKSVKQQHLYATAQVGLNFDRVQSKGDIHTAQQSAGAIAVGYRKSKWGVEAGIQYQRKQFQPKRSVEIFAGNAAQGYYGSYLAEVDADVISVPVRATRRIAKVGKVTAHAIAGLSAHVAVQKGYRNKTLFFPGSNPAGPDPQSPNTVPQFQQVGKGLLESGGVWKSNQYATADAGLRLEAPVGQRTAVFVESAYRHALPGSEGLSNIHSSINTVSLSAGIVAGL